MESPPKFEVGSGRLQVDIYQLADDDAFAAHRTDGTGWSWSWADWRREWMDATAGKFAYRCLPLTIANQTGWVVNNPVGFTAIWTGQPGTDGVLFKFDTAPAVWREWVNSQFGNGILTWGSPLLFRTRPAQSRLLVMGPPNRFKHGAQPLTAIVESDWMTASFTMNYKLTQPGQPVRFDAGEPLFQVVPVAVNLCADLEQADVTFRRLADDRATHDAFFEWKRSRDAFKQAQRAGDVSQDAWQKNYFKGHDMLGRPVGRGHATKLTPPTVHYLTPGTGKGIGTGEQ